MLKRLFALTLGVIMSVMMTTAVFAEFVYITEHGKKYHKEGSRFLKNREVEKITLEEAEERGYEPSREFLEEASSESKPSKAKSSVKKK